MPVRVEQVRTLLYGSEEIGMGFNSDTGKAVGTALDFDLPEPARGQESRAHATIIRSQQSLESSLDLSFEADGRYGMVSAGLKIGFHKDTTFNSHSTFVLAKSRIQNQIRRGKNFRVNDAARELLRSNRLTEFARAYGDSFVRGVFTGGEYYALIRVTSYDKTVQERLGAELEAEINGGLAGGGFKASYNSANSRSESRSEYSVSFYQRGGSGAEEAGTTLEIDDVRHRLETFASAIRDHPYPYSIEVATYDTVPLPTEPKEQIETLLASLEDANARRLVYMQKRNDMQFALDHPEFFVGLPAPEVLQHGVNEFTRALNAVIRHAAQLSRGEIEPVYFVESSISPRFDPPAIRLKRRTSDDAKTFLDWYLLRHDPSLLREDRVYLERVVSWGSDRLQDFDAIRDPGGDAARTAVLQAEALTRVLPGLHDFQYVPATPMDPAAAVLTLGHLPDMAPRTLRALEISSAGLEDLRGIGRLPDLQEVVVSYNRISDISPVDELESLRRLDVTGNRIADLSPLRACTELETLSIGGNAIAVLEPIGGLAKLKNLSLGQLRTVSVNDAHETTILNNPFLSVDVLRDMPALANPFVQGDELRVRLGVRRDGPDGQFTGAARRIKRSNVFQVSLKRGVEACEDRFVVLGVWSELDLSRFDAAAGEYVVVALVRERGARPWWLRVPKSDRSRGDSESLVPDPAAETIEVEIVR
jgi:hypothetical protein